MLFIDVAHGLILELEKENDILCPFGNYHLRYFDCNLLSCYSNENECLFYGGCYKIKIGSIRLMAQKKNLLLFFKGLEQLDRSSDTIL